MNGPREEAKNRGLLLADAFINGVLGVPLMLFPGPAAAVLGLPIPEPGFYPSILGAILIGIGIALIWEVRFPRGRFTGLGLAGAVIINLCGGGALLFWLVAGDLVLPFRGRAFLWILTVAVLGIGALELAWRSPTPKQ